jgi:hypothetical protein
VVLTARRYEHGFQCGGGKEKKKKKITTKYLSCDSQVLYPLTLTLYFYFRRRFFFFFLWLITRSRYDENNRFRVDDIGTGEQGKKGSVSINYYVQHYRQAVVVRDRPQITGRKKKRL